MKLSQNIRDFKAKSREQGLQYTYYQAFCAVPGRVGYFIDTLLGLNGLFSSTRKQDPLKGPFGALLGIPFGLLGAALGGLVNFILVIPGYIGRGIDKAINRLLPGYDSFMQVGPDKLLKNVSPSRQLQDLLVGLGYVAMFLNRVFTLFFHKPPTIMAAPFGFVLGAIPEVARWLLISPIAYPVCTFNWVMGNTCEGIQNFYSGVGKGLSKVWARLTGKPGAPGGGGSQPRVPQTSPKPKTTATDKPSSGSRSSRNKLKRNKENKEFQLKEEEKKREEKQAADEKRQAKLKGEEYFNQGINLFAVLGLEKSVEMTEKQVEKAHKKKLTHVAQDKEVIFCKKYKAANPNTSLDDSQIDALREQQRLLVEDAKNILVTHGWLSYFKDCALNNYQQNNSAYNELLKANQLKKNSNLKVPKNSAIVSNSSPISQPDKTNNSNNTQEVIKQPTTTGRRKLRRK